MRDPVIDDLNRYETKTAAEQLIAEEFFREATEEVIGDVDEIAGEIEHESSLIFLLRAILGGGSPTEIGERAYQAAKDLENEAIQARAERKMLRAW